jgi:isopenicillin-N epimerase
VQLARSASPAADWALDPTVTYLNHGAFGACLRGILDVQQGWRSKLETDPVRFLTRDLEDLLDWTRSELASYVGADADDLALLTNTTVAINTVLRSVQFDRGDEVLATDHAYNASLNALRYAAARAGAKVVLARIPFPIGSPDEVFEAIMSAVTPRTKLAVIEHVTSPTALILPIERLIPALAEKGRRHARGWCPRPRDASASDRRAGSGLLRRCRAQMAVCAQGLGLPLGSA